MMMIIIIDKSEVNCLDSDSEVYKCVPSVSPTVLVDEDDDGLSNTSTVGLPLQVADLQFYYDPTRFRPSGD